MTRVGTLVRRNFEPMMLSVQVIVDLLVVVAACVSAFALHGALFPLEKGVVDASYDIVTYREVFSITAAVCLLCFHWFGMYSPIKSLLNVEEFKSVAKSAATAFLVVSTLIVFLTQTTAGQDRGGDGFFDQVGSWFVQLHHHVDLNMPQDTLNRPVLLMAFILILVFTMISRFVSFKLIQGLHRKGVGNRNVAVIGEGPTGQSLQRKFLLVPTLGLNFVGFIGADKSRVGTMIERSRVLGTTDDLERILGLHKISEVFVALPEAPEQEVMEVITELEHLGVNYHVVPRFYHLMSYNVRIENLDSIPLISRPERRVSVLGAFTKRSLDLCLATTVLLFGAAFFLISAIMIKRESKGPVFFRQTRVGRDGKAFQLFKFRTMHHSHCGDEVAPQNEYDPRVTRVGRFLRRYSLDELPNFLNVLRGEMSVVGPRPEMPFIVETYNTMDHERLRAKPGVTGLWQISYARTQSIHENLDYDLYYIENQSLLLDLVIIALTGFAVAKGTGAY
jgi:putative colanic acid biosynthesis UDP-glucose lipid carrier transferase